MIPSKNVLGNPNVTEGDFQIAIESLRESVIGSGKPYDSANTYAKYDTCVSGGVTYYSKVDGNVGNTPAINTYWGDIADLISSVVHKTGDETIAGVKTFSSSPIVPVPTLVNQAISMGNIIEKTGSGLGYGTGSGGTVTQLTSKGTAVTLNKPSGQITMHNASLVAGASVTFQFNNSVLNAVTDSLLLTINNPISGYNYRVDVAGLLTAIGAQIRVTNTSGSTLSDAITINFAVIKGAIA